MEESAIPSLLGVIGHPIAGYPMQFVMEQALQAAGLEWRFLSFDVPPERLEDAFRGVDALGFQGISIAPHFGSPAYQLVQSHTATANAAKWIDALVRDDTGKLVGHNLLGDAVLSLLAPTASEGTIVAVLGDSPRSQAIADTLAMEPVLCSVRRELQDLGSLQILIRSTKNVDETGITEISEKQIDQLNSQCIVVDLATHASTSPLLRFAASRGLPTLSAIDLLVGRAALAFRLWTGQEADESRVRDAFEEYLEI